MANLPNFPEILHELVSEQDLPAAIASERIIIGVALESEEFRQGILVNGLTATDFFDHYHSRIFAALTAMHKAGEPIDSYLVAEKLARDADIVARLADCISSGFVLSAAIVGAHVRLLKHKSALRKLIEAGQRLVSRALEPDADPAIIASNIQTDLQGVSL